MKIYTYAIIDSKDKLNWLIKGLEGAPVYNIPYQDIGVISNVLNKEVQDIKPECTLEHEKVVERLMEDFTILPMRFLTVFNKKEDVLSMMKDYYGDFKENLGRLRNKVEFGIKVIWPGDAIKESIVNSYPESKHKLPISGDSPGKKYIRERFSKYMIDKEFEEEADRHVAVVDNFFREFAAEKRLERLKSNNLLLNASYLVEKDKQGDFKRAFERLKSASCDLKYLFSGPWPPYNFVVLTKRMQCGDG